VEVARRARREAGTRLDGRMRHSVKYFARRAVDLGVSNSWRGSPRSSERLKFCGVRRARDGSIACIHPHG
jgi:hypothetical protein